MEIVTSRQWYITNGGRDQNLAQALIARGGEMNWHPPYMQSRYTNWIDGLNGDWLISRQRFFGVPFELKERGKAFVLLDASSPESRRLRIESDQIDGRVQGIHFLLAGIGRAEHLDEVARLRVTYGDGKRQDFQLRYWREVTSYKFPETTPESGVAWLEIDEKYTGHFTGQVIGFSHHRWKNPRSSKALKKVELVSTKGPVNLLVLGVTIESDGS